MQFYPKRTVEEQANRLPYELREAYRNSQMDRITIFDGTEKIEVTGYAEYSFLEEKSYKTQPVRSQDGKIEEIEEYATFLTPRLIIKYNMMGIEDYRALMKMLKRKNAFYVTCYDVVEDKIVTNEMYVATPSMPIIYQQYLMALGIQEYTIELIGTNNTAQITFKVDIADEIEFKTDYPITWKEFVEQNKNYFSIRQYEYTDRVFFTYNGATKILSYDDSYYLVEANDYIERGLYYALDY